MPSPVLVTVKVAPSSMPVAPPVSVIEFVQVWLVPVAVHCCAHASDAGQDNVSASVPKNTAAATGGATSSAALDAPLSKRVRRALQLWTFKKDVEARRSFTAISPIPGENTSHTHCLPAQRVALRARLLRPVNA
jgi:hypothetical protein